MGDTTDGAVIGRTTSESTPWWPDPVLPGEGTPNIIVVLLDDTGFAHLGCYGGLIDTPNFDRLAERGLRYTNFHTTALCSPTRACLLTGRNHHSVGMRALANFDTGYPNMRGRIARSAGTMAEMLGEVVVQVALDFQILDDHLNYPISLLQLREIILNVPRSDLFDVALVH